MSKTVQIASSLLFPVAAIAAPLANRPAVVPHVPADCGSMRHIDPAAAGVNHIAVVNVGNAVPSADWPRIVTYAAAKLNLNVWTNAVEKTLFPALLDDPGLIAKTFGGKARFIVFVEEGNDSTPFLAAPGSWCRVNTRHLKHGNPDRQVLCDRMCKAILKGVAHACGAGLALDGHSANCIGSVGIDGLDNAVFSITPDSYFPMLESIRVLGGEEILSPARSEQ